ncbi:MAG: ECF transporter S component [Candidatus Brockarchaeota archaeon]|nr:ECF transporter S component [Candidatus Brockarchaeota archaeon]
MRNRSVSKARLVSSAALSTALVFMATASVSIYIPATRGYFNLGDSMIFLTALLFGPLVGFLAGGLGSMLSDLFLGYTVYAPATLIVKGVEGFLTAFLHEAFAGKESRATRLLMVFLPVPTVILGTMLVIFLFTGEAEVSLLTIYSATIAYQPILFTILIVLAASLIFILRVYRENLPLIVPCFIGGFEMVLGYFLYELSLYQLGAVFEVPANFAQTFLGTLVAVPLYNAVAKRIGQSRIISR